MAVKNRTGMLCVEWATLIYVAITAAAILMLADRMPNSGEMLTNRTFVALGIALLIQADLHYRKPITRLLRYILPLALTALWYPETYEFSSLISNQDHVFANADQWLFGCQPAIGFADILSGTLWSEIFNMGYFSYYPMIACGLLVPIIWKRDALDRTATIVLVSFFIFYLVFLCLPVAGPQFYYPAVGEENIVQGIFPVLGNYFQTHPALPHLESESSGGLFQWLVEFMQRSGERPTAAFPSSHVGISTVLMFTFWKNRKSVFWIFLPFYVVLCAATVYIRAHYLVDVIGGLVLAVVAYYVSSWIARKTEVPYPYANAPE